MASRIALNALRSSASRVRPRAAVPQFLSSRTTASSSSSNPPPPAERTASIVDKFLSHPSLITKTGTAILGSGLLATAISQELYLFNEETVIAVGYFILFAYISKTVRLPYKPYKEWAENHDMHVKHMRAMKDHVNEVGQMKDVSLTKRLFEVSKVTALHKADTFVQCHIKVRALHLDCHLHNGGYPQYILTNAATLNNDNESIENKFFPLYNQILHYWFPLTEGYNVYPKWPWSIPNSRKIEDFTINFVIEHQHHPLLLIDIKPPLDFQLHSGCSIAIAQVINHLDEIRPNNLHADQLYAISAIGKRWRACYTLKGKNSEGGGWPVKGIAVKNSLRSAHPECWNPDITSNASWVALQSIVDTIKGYVAQ